MQSKNFNQVTDLFLTMGYLEMEKEINDSQNSWQGIKKLNQEFFSVVELVVFRHDPENVIQNSVVLSRQHFQNMVDSIG
ncbi:hypothetical protein [Tumebacillus permanentifrigoris]|uniref:Uncharacterized protein n=1 Tax=Tumebacillus permanentifrigoris TaxID=378543 RepID=A0A316D6A8_9BACL|nr:hypothetical protein [Tumebacillus permanentifrigoris]PWK08351.1 hypothetical protein C7459_1152 [Tumebacillus permanentifrigoris]